jgi:hypothetical protein
LHRICGAVDKRIEPGGKQHWQVIPHSTSTSGETSETDVGAKH